MDAAAWDVLSSDIQEYGFELEEQVLADSKNRAREFERKRAEEEQKRWADLQAAVPGQEHPRGSYFGVGDQHSGNSRVPGRGSQDDPMVISSASSSPLRGEEEGGGLEGESDEQTRERHRGMVAAAMAELTNSQNDVLESFMAVTGA